MELCEEAARPARARRCITRLAAALLLGHLAIAPAAAQPTPLSPPASPEGETAAFGTSAPQTEPRSLLTWAYEALGLFYLLVFGSLSFSLVALLVVNIRSAARRAVLPPDLVDRAGTIRTAQEAGALWDALQQNDSPLGRVMRAAVGHLRSGLQAATEAAGNVESEEDRKLEHRLSHLALIGTVSPMVGLLGTVQGMIASFLVIAQRTTTPEPSELAAGISTALLTTFVGLAIAIPALASYNILRNRVARLILEVELVCDGLLARLGPAAKGQKGA